MAGNHAPSQQPAQATQAELTDAEIEALFGKCGGHWSGDRWVIEDADLHPFARAILALRPQAVPMTDGIRPEDFTVDVVVKPMGGFAPVNTHGVRVTHKPTGVSVTCDAARSQHANRQQAFEKLSAILALRPERAPMTGEQWTDVLGSAGPDMLDLAKRWADNKIHVYQVVHQAEKIVKAAVLRGITAQIKKETP